MNRKERRHPRKEIKRVNAPPSVEEKGGPPKVRWIPNTILCAKCGRGGGTLHKIEDGYYVHMYCPGE